MKIDCQSVNRTYGKTFALKDIRLQVKENTICGLLGRNGAGKTTLMHILTGQLLPSSGSVLINGEIPFENRNVLKSLCFIKESGNFKSNFKVGEILSLSSLFYPHWNQTLAKDLLQQFHLDPKKSVKALSKGMESALGIIVGLASRAPITIFDEPYIGMDAVARQHFYHLLIEEYTEHPRTFILSTHLIDEISKIFEDVIILQNGEVVLHEKADRLRNNGFTVTGKTEDVDLFCEGKSILHSESFGGTKKVSFYSEDHNQKEADLMRLTVEPLPIQDLMIHLTSSQKGERQL